MLPLHHPPKGDRTEAVAWGRLFSPDVVVQPKVRVGKSQWESLDRRHKPRTARQFFSVPAGAALVHMRRPSVGTWFFLAEGPIEQRRRCGRA